MRYAIMRITAVHNVQYNTTSFGGERQTFGGGDVSVGRWTEERNIANEICGIPKRMRLSREQL